MEQEQSVFESKDNRIAVAANILVTECHSRAANAGWWNEAKLGDTIYPRIVPYLVPAKLALVHSEISEAVEGDRKGLQDDHLPHRSMLEVELADAVIRIADLAGALGLDLGGAIAEKLEYNARRADHKLENRAKIGGKSY